MSATIRSPPAARPSVDYAISYVDRHASRSRRRRSRSRPKTSPRSTGLRSSQLTAAYDGLVNGDTPASLRHRSPRCPRRPRPPVTSAIIPITASGAVDAGLCDRFHRRTSSQSRRRGLTITADRQIQVVRRGHPRADRQPTTGLVNGDTPASLTTQADAVPRRPRQPAAVGSYPITAGGAADPDYTITLSRRDLQRSRPRP